MQAGDPTVAVTINPDAWHSYSDASQVVEKLGSSTSTGLSSAEASRRLQHSGPNRLTPADKPGFLKRLWNQLNSLLIWILIACAIVEGALQSWAEFGLVLAVVILNTAIGMIQEGKAEKAAEAIKAMLSSNAQVLRDGERKVISAEELVTGDIVFMKSGDNVPADIRLLEANNLQVQEALLTGESVPSSKNLHAVPVDAPLGDRKCMCYSATAVVSGQATGVVVATGDNAEIGQINKMVNTVERVQNNLMHQLDILGRWITVMVGVFALIAFLLALLRIGERFSEAIESAVSIAVAMIPEGLPAVVTIVLAIGTVVMARNYAIIRQLPAVETLGSLNIICSDKTGTLTKNEMTAVAVRSAAALYHISGVGYAPTGSFRTATSIGHSSSGRTYDLATSSRGSGLATTSRNPGTPHTPNIPGIPQPPTTKLPGTQPDSRTASMTEYSDTAHSLALGLKPNMEAIRSLLRGAILCNDSSLRQETDELTKKTIYTPLGAPTEVALLTAGQKAGLNAQQLVAEAPRIKTVPFESEHKFMATVHEEGGRRVMYVKGAPDRLWPMCNRQVVADSFQAAAAPLDLKFWQAQQEELSSQGLRVLALCRTELSPDEDLELLTPKAIQEREPFLAMVLLVAILDPPRPEAITAVKEAHSAGITVKMITGDHALTALAIGRMLDIAGKGVVWTGPQVDHMDDEELERAVMDCNVFARASPANKLRIVRALQAQKQVVAMTGDGVNDAPALKAADVGVAMGITGTDVSKEAAKMVLADDNFATIVAAVKEGRRVWDNIRKILIFNLPVNLAQGLSVLYSNILGLPAPPLTALQVLLVNMVTSVTLGLALAAEPAEPTIMSRPPRRAGKRLVGKLLLWRMFFVSHLIVILVIGAYYWGGQTGLSLDERRAEAFAILVLSQVVYLINCRFFKLSTFHPRVLRGNHIVFLAMLITTGILMFFIYTPKVNEVFHMTSMVGISWARTVVCMAIVYFTVEIEKALVDPVLMPVIRPVLAWMESKTPDWLSVNPLKPLNGAVRRLRSRKKDENNSNTERAQETLPK